MSKYNPFNWSPSFAKVTSSVLSILIQDCLHLNTDGQECAKRQLNVPTRSKSIINGSMQVSISANYNTGPPIK